MMTRLLINLTVLLLGAFVSAQYHNSVRDYRECDSRICLSSRGYIKYRGDVANDRKIWTISNRQKFTTIVLHLKNIKIPDALSSPWLRIYVQQRSTVKKIEVENAMEVFFSFNDSNEAIIEVSNEDGVEFTMNYYVGCVVMEGSDETIHKTKEVPKTYLEYLTKFSNFPTCWIIFPVSREQKVLKKLQKLARGSSHSLQLTRNIEVQRMYLTFKDAWVPNGTTIQVNDLVTGESVVQIGTIESLMVATLDETLYRVKYVGNDSYMMSNVIFVDLKCSQADDCRRTQFNFSTLGIQSRDLSCIQEQSKCLFNVGDGNYNCRPNYTSPISALQRVSSEAMVTTSCTAFNRLSATIMDEVIFSNGGREVTPRSGSLVIRSSCLNHGSFCKKKCNRKIFKQKGCDKLCFFIKKVLFYCRATRAVFS